jgi:hypothetical protein
MNCSLSAMHNAMPVLSDFSSESLLLEPQDLGNSTGHAVGSSTGHAVAGASATTADGG